MAKLGFDVDGVVVQPYLFWWKWLQNMSVIKLPYPDHQTEINYDLSTYFKEYLPEGVDPFDFWRGTSLYDFLEPSPNCVTVINNLKSEGHEIYWITHCKGYHGKSKFKFIERNFPIDAFFITKEKHEIKVDTMVDDRSDILNKFDPSVLRIKYNSPFTQKEKLKQGIISTGSWKEIESLLSNKKQGIF